MSNPHVIINFLCQFDGVRGAQTAGVTVVLSVPMRVFPEEISI